MNQNSESVDPTPAENWFVATTSTGTVEYSLDDLIPAIQSGHISSHNLVWRQGMSDWLEIEQVPLLRMIAVPFENQAKKPDAIVDVAPLVSKVEDVSNYPVLDEFEATVIQPRLDLLDDNSWTIEPKPEPHKALNQAPLSIHDLVKRGAVPLAPASPQPASKLLARPALVRPAVAKLDFTNFAPESNVSRNIQEIRPEPPQISAESETVSSQADQSLPKAAASTARLTSKAPPKPRDSTIPQASTAARDANPPLASLRANATSGGLPRTNKTVSPASTIAAAANERTAARAAAQAPSECATSAREVPKTVAPSLTVSRAPTPVQPAASTSTRSIAPTPTRATTSTSTHAVAPTPARATSVTSQLSASTSTLASVPVAAQSTNVFQTPHSVGAIAPAPVETVGSLIPAVTSIDHDMPQWRKSRRPLVVTSGAVAAVVIAVFVSVGASTKKSDVVRPVAAKLAAAAPSDLPVVAASAAPSVPEIASEQAPFARETSSIPSSTKASKRATPIDVASSANVARSTRKQTREIDAPVANRQLSEPKDPPIESSSTSKSTTPSTKKVNGNASSVASWDQGTVEHRTWMNPGF